MTTPALQLTTDNLLVNFDYQGDIVDLCWPSKAEDNLCLRDKISFKVYTSEKELITTKLNEQIINNGQSNYPFNSINRIDDKISYTYSPALPTNDRLELYYNFENTTSEQIDCILILHIPLDFGANMSRDCVFYHPEYSGLVFYEADKYVGVRADITPEEFACHDPKDNAGRGARPDKDLSLSNNPVSTGRVEGGLKYKISVPAGGVSNLTVYFDFANDLTGLMKKKESDQSQIIPVAMAFTNSYITPKTIEDLGLATVEAEKLQLLEASSRNLILGSIVPTGGSFAAVDSSYYKSHGSDDYSYFWPRDGAFTIQALAGVLADGSKLKEILNRHYDYVLRCFADKPYLEHRYRLNSSASLASSWYPWQGFADNPVGRLQLDQTAITLVSYARINQANNYNHPDFEATVQKICEFLADCIEADGSHKACYDLWENHSGKFTSTQAAIIAGLKAGIQVLNRSTSRNEYTELVGGLELVIYKALNALQTIFVKEGKFIRGLISTNQRDSGYTIDKSADSSVNLVWILGVLAAETQVVKDSVEDAAAKLETSALPGAYARYERDHYLNSHPESTGNPWYISSFWFAAYFAKTGRFKKTSQTINWAIKHMEPAGLLPEMADPVTGFGLSVRPLIWSHVELLNLLNYLRE